MCVRLGGWVGLGVCPPPVLTDPEAPSPEVLRQTCQVVSGSLGVGLGASERHSSMRTSTPQSTMWTIGVLRATVVRLNPGLLLTTRHHCGTGGWGAGPAPPTDPPAPPHPRPPTSI